MPKRIRKKTKQQLIAELARRAGTPKNLAAEFLEHLRDIILDELRTIGTIVLPELVRFTLKDKPATPERTALNPFTKQPTLIKAKPASKAVKVAPLKAFKESVS